MNFSMVLIARNEEKTLPRMLKSLEEFRSRGGGVYILDTGSTDNTAQIARDWGCRVEEVGNRFRVYLTDDDVKNINEKFIVDGEPPAVKRGDSFFHFSNARNYAATMASTDWIWQPDSDEVFTNLNLDAIEEAMKDPMTDTLTYDFVFAHDDDGKPTIEFQHAKCYRKSKKEWKGAIHEVLDMKTPS